MKRRVLAVADVAGVGAELKHGLERFTHWEVEAVGLPNLAAGSGRVLHAAGAAYRAATIPVHVRAAVRRSEPDIVHLHWARFAPLMPRSARPLVVHAHGSDVRARSRTAAGRLVTASLERADVVLTSTADLLADLPAGARRLPSPVDTTVFAPKDQQQQRLGRTRVLIFARLSDVKGGRYLVELARDLKRAHPRLEVAAFEGGAYDLAARGAGVELLGPTDKAGVAAELLRADLVIGQQQLGVIGLSELEAMACACAVVAFVEPQFRDPGLPVISPSNRGEQLVELCMELLEDPERRRCLGVEGRRFVERVHSPLAVATELAQIYDDLTG